MRSVIRWTAVGAVLFSVSSASAQRRPPPGQPQPSAAEQQAIQQGLGALLQAFGGGEQAAPAPLVEHRELRALLPASLTGMRRASISSERSGAMGVAVARAEAKYEGAGGASIDIEIVDLGGMGGFAAMAQAGWAAADIDRETDTGFERTVNYKGHKAMEEFDTARRSGKMQVLIGGRLMVGVQGNGVDFNAIRAAMDQIDLQKLAALKPAEAAK